MHALSYLLVAITFKTVTPPICSGHLQSIDRTISIFCGVDTA